MTSNLSGLESSQEDQGGHSLAEAREGQSGDEGVHKISHQAGDQAEGYGVGLLALNNCPRLLRTQPAMLPVCLQQGSEPCIDTGITR